MKRISTRKTLPEKGRTADDMAAFLSGCKSHDARWDHGKVFGFVYHPGKSHTEVSESYLRAFQYENTLNPSTFPSLMKFERDIVSMSAGLMHGSRLVSGSVTSGGTESIFLSLKTAREHARETRQVEGQYEVILPETIHPAFLKACEYLSLNVVPVPVTRDRKADPEGMERSITERTILMACSAPCFPYGVVDPVEAIGRIARKHNILFHVDACLGGFMLPFLEDLGYPVPPFDFRVPGVTSISMDAHKYGYAPKGSSILLYRNRTLRKKQFFIHTEWPGGIFASTTFMGTKSGGPLAGCWAMMNHLGKEGYRSIAAQVMKTTRNIVAGIEQIEGLQLVAEPAMSVFAFTSTEMDIHQIGDALAMRGWHLDRLQFPDALHMTITQLHTGIEDQFLLDLEEIIHEKASIARTKRTTMRTAKLTGKILKTLPEGMVERMARKVGAAMGAPGKGSQNSQAALYGISASIHNRKNMKHFVMNLIDGIY
jgi:sphinganine-1-phosphate aldolase